MLAAVLPLLFAAAEIEADPPERAARVTEASGEILFMEAGGEEWSTFERNRPVIAGDTLFTQGDARSEIDLGTGKLWLDYASGLAFTQFDPADVGAALQQGSLRYDKKSAADTLTFAVADAAKLRVVIEGRGHGRVDRTAPDRITITVDEGSACVQLGDYGYVLDAGETLFLRSGAVRVTTDLRTHDGFDDWVAARSWAESESDQYVAPTVAGRAELDRYGTWQTTADYGAVWFPSAVADDWAPYRDGHWVATVSYGWTWVDAAPWGYAPFHYGRWARIGARWGWCPGERVMHVAFAPALVVFVAAVASAISWAPLGYHEVYQPTYRCSPRYAVAINRPYRHARVVDGPRIVTLPGLTTIAQGNCRTARVVRDVMIARPPQAPPIVAVPPPLPLPPRRDAIAVTPVVQRVPPRLVPPTLLPRVFDPPRASLPPRLPEAPPPVMSRPHRENTFTVSIPSREREAQRVITDPPPFTRPRFDPPAPIVRAPSPSRVDRPRFDPPRYDRPRFDPPPPPQIVPVRPAPQITPQITPMPRYVPPVAPMPRYVPPARATPPTPPIVPMRPTPAPQVLPARPMPAPSVTPRPTITPPPQLRLPDRGPVQRVFRR